MTKQTLDLVYRITAYLSNGGLFNPELADHVAVRNLLIECREALAQPPIAWLPPDPPPECETEAEKTAFAFGWWKALETQRMAQPEQEPVKYSIGHCENHRQKGGCQLHNLQCGWPDCDRKPLTSQERDAQRWRFLMENSYDSESVTQFHVWEHSWEPHSLTGEPTEWKQRVRGIGLIDFIDRAIEATHGISNPKK